MLCVLKPQDLQQLLYEDNEGFSEVYLDKKKATTTFTKHIFSKVYYFVKTLVCPNNIITSEL